MKNLPKMICSIEAYKQGYEIEKKETKRDNKEIKAKIKALEAKLNKKNNESAVKFHRILQIQGRNLTACHS